MVDHDEGVRQHPAIRSFVKRTGRLTRGQQHALENFWPLYGIDFQPHQTLDFKREFGRPGGVKLEIGFGNGDSLVQMAASDQACNYIGIEVHDPGVGHCLQQIHQQRLQNLKLISHDAVEVLDEMIPDASLDAVFIFFPDPWHKKRHHKRRIVKKSFRDRLVRVMKSGAILHLATDWVDYAEHMAGELVSDERFDSLGNESGYVDKPDYRPVTKFERRGIRLGHEVRDLMFRKR